MVKLLYWAKPLTRASVQDMNEMPHPYTVTSLCGTFPRDVRVLSRRKPQDFMEVGSFIFVSSKVKTILEAHKAAVELFPVSVTYRGETFGGWFYLHLLQEVDCLNPEKTIRAGPQDPQPRLIKHMVLRESACAGIPLFRIADSAMIGVSDGLALALASARCRGAIFPKPEEWKNPALRYD